MLLISANAAILVAQQTQSVGSVSVSAESAEKPAQGRLIITLTDVHGAVLPNVRIELVEPNGAIERTGTSDANGKVQFDSLRAGTYQAKVASIGFASTESAEVLLKADETQQLPMTAMNSATTTTTVHVVASLDEVAQAQVQEQEKQKVLGFLPNYYVSYIWNAAPMTPKLKFRLALRSAFDPATFLIVAGVAGVEQAHETFPGYGQESEGYAKRYASTYGDTLISSMVSRAVLASVFHQDPRYFYRGSGSIRSRILYALLQSVECRGDNGHTEPNYSALIGGFAAAGLSNLYRAPGDRSAGLTLRNSLIVIGGHAANNLFREFLSRKMTPAVPPFANGKP